MESLLAGNSRAKRACLLSLVVLGLVVGLLAMPAAALDTADNQTNDGINWLQLVMGLFGGLGLFLLGMEYMAGALKAVAGQRMKSILATLTTNRVTAAMTGAFVTAVIQSSSVTTVLVVGFIAAGLMPLTQSIGIIMGANVGTTITAQIVAFKVTKAALLMIAVGFGLMFFTKRDTIKQYGNMLLGLGLVFFGMTVMSDSMGPLRNYAPFLDLMRNIENPLLGILIAAAFTALVQSSSATTGIVIVMASQGFVSLEAGIALALGANVGTCVTALLAAIGKPRDATRAAVVHVVFNVLGVLMWIGFIDHLATVAAWLSPAYPELSGAQRIAAEAPRQIANANTFFNLANTLLFLPFVGFWARLANLLVPDLPPDAEKAMARPKYLDEELLNTPSLALQRARFEVGRIGKITNTMLAQIDGALMARDRAAIDEVVAMDDKADCLHEAVLRYLGKIHRHSLTERETRLYQDLVTASYNLEAIGDVVETDLAKVGIEMIEKEVTMSETMRDAVAELHHEVSTAVANAIKAVVDTDAHAAIAVFRMREEINAQIDAVLQHQSSKLSEGDEQRLTLFRLEMALIEAQKRIYTLARRIAKGSLPKDMMGNGHELTA